MGQPCHSPLEVSVLLQPDWDHFVLAFTLLLIPPQAQALLPLADSASPVPQGPEQQGFWLREAFPQLS